MAKPYYALKNFCRWSLPASLVPRATALCSIAADMHYEASLPPPPVRCINLTTQQHHLRSVWVWLAGHIKPWCSPCNVCHGVYRRWKDYWRKNWTFLRFLYIFVQCLCALVWEMTLAGCIFFLREMGETTQDFHLQLCITQLQKVHLAIKFSDFLPVSSPLFWVISFRYHLWCTTSLHLAGFTGKQHWIVICSNFKATYFTSSKTSGMSRCWRNNTTLHDVLCLETWMDACILLYWPMDEWSRQKHEDIVASAFLPLSHKSLQFKFGNEQNITKLPRGLGLGMLRAHPKTFSISPWSAPQNWDLLSPERP